MNGYTFLGFLAGGVAGAVTMFFVLRNNPKFLRLKKLSQAALTELKKKIDTALEQK